MQKHIITAALLSLLLVLFSATGALSEEAALEVPQPLVVESENKGTPNLVFEAKEHDFGKMKQQESVKHVFKFRNEGDALLVIDKVKATCGCTGTLLSNSEISPGEAGEIEVTFKSGLSGGKKKKSIYVHSNDPDGPSEQLYIIAEVIVAVEVRPRQIYWAAEKGETSERVVELFYQPDLDIKIAGLKTSNSAFTATATPKVDSDRPGYDIDIVFDGSLARGNFREKLTITTDNPEHQMLNVMIRGRIEGELKAIPNAVALGVVKDELPITRQIRIYARGDRPFEISSIESTTPLISTDTVPDEEAGGYRINVVLTEKPPQGAFSQKLHITTSLEPDRPLEVGVYAFVQ